MLLASRNCVEEWERELKEKEENKLGNKYANMMRGKMKEMFKLELSEEGQRLKSNSSQEREHIFLFMFASMFLLERYDFLRVFLKKLQSETLKDSDDF